jgi:hypothetical protein
MSHTVMYFTRKLEIKEVTDCKSIADAFWCLRANEQDPVCYFRLTPGRFAWLGAKRKQLKDRIEITGEQLKGDLSEGERSDRELLLNEMREKLTRDTPALRELKCYFEITFPEVCLARVTPESPIEPPLISEAKDLPSLLRCHESTPSSLLQMKDVVEVDELAMLIRKKIANLPDGPVQLAPWLSLSRASRWGERLVESVNKSRSNASMSFTDYASRLQWLDDYAQSQK